MEIVEEINQILLQFWLYIIFFSEIPKCQVVAIFFCELNPLYCQLCHLTIPNYVDIYTKGLHYACHDDQMSHKAKQGS